MGVQQTDQDEVDEEALDSVLALGHVAEVEEALTMVTLWARYHARGDG
jgi:hypothetical protein